MSSQTDFLLSRVSEAKAAAASANLANVRDNHLRAAAAWEALATRAVKGEEIRAEEAIRKAERDAEDARRIADEM